MKAQKVAILSSGDATFPLLAKILRYVNIVAQSEKSPPPSRKSRRRPVGKVAAAQPLPPKPAGTTCRAVSRASRPAVAAEARRNDLPSGVYASRLMTQKRLRLAHQATDANACPMGTVAFPCATPSRFSCAGDILSPVPLWVAKRIQSPCPLGTATRTSIGIPCTMRFADLDIVATPALRLTKSYQLLWLLKKRTSDVTFIEVENSKVAKTFGHNRAGCSFWRYALVGNFENLRLR